MLRRRVGIAWVLLVVTLAAMSAGVGWYLWPRPALARKANETIELPLVPPGSHAWSAVNAFPKLNFAEPVFAASAPGNEHLLYVLERRGTLVAIDLQAEAPAKQMVLDIRQQVDTTADGVDAFLKQYRVPWPQVHEPGGLESPPAKTFGIISLPTMFLVGPDGKVVTRNPSVPDLKTQLPELLKAK